MYKFLMMTTSFWLVGISGGVVPRQESSSRQGLDAALLLQVFEVYSMPLILRFLFGCLSSKAVISFVC